MYYGKSQGPSSPKSLGIQGFTEDAAGRSDWHLNDSEGLIHSLILSDTASIGSASSSLSVPRRCEGEKKTTMALLS